MATRSSVIAECSTRIARPGRGDGPTATSCRWSSGSTKRSPAVDGHGFVDHAADEEPGLGQRSVYQARYGSKDDTGNVGGSHKGRHLFGLMLHYAIAMTCQPQTADWRSRRAAMRLWLRQSSPGSRSAAAGVHPDRCRAGEWWLGSPALGATTVVCQRVPGEARRSVLPPLPGGGRCWGAARSAVREPTRRAHRRRAHHRARARRATLRCAPRSSAPRPLLRASRWGSAGIGVRARHGRSGAGMRWLDGCRACTRCRPKVRRRSCGPGVCCASGWAPQRHGERRRMDGGYARRTTDELMWPWERRRTASPTASSTMSPTTGSAWSKHAAHGRQCIVGKRSGGNPGQRTRPPVYEYCGRPHRISRFSRSPTYVGGSKRRVDRSALYRARALSVWPNVEYPAPRRLSRTSMPVPDGSLGLDHFGGATRSAFVDTGSAPPRCPLRKFRLVQGSDERGPAAVVFSKNRHVLLEFVAEPGDVRDIAGFD